MSKRESAVTAAAPEIETEAEGKSETERFINRNANAMRRIARALESVPDSDALTVLQIASENADEMRRAALEQILASLEKLDDRSRHLVLDHVTASVERRT